MAEIARSAQPGTDPNREREARRALERVLASKEFRASRRCQDFLRYVVATTLAGHADTLKERTIGIEAFGRPVAYDPSDDASVRVKAGEVRRRLELYYAAEGRADPWRIELPPGTYVPEFKSVPAPLPAPDAPRARRTRSWSPAWWALGALVLGGLASHWFWPPVEGANPAVASAAAEAVMQRFWSPVLAGTAPVLLSASYVPVYAPKQPWMQTATGSRNLILLPDQFVGGGDLVAAADVAAMLTRMRRRYDLKIGNQVTFSDLRGGPAVLVGYSYTRWKELSNDFRYYFQIEHEPFGVTDRGRPTPWVLRQLTSDRHTPEDYAIVSRVLDPATQAMLVEVAGVTQYGTEAGAELITDPEKLAAALRGAPPGWQKRNLQLVIHVRVIANTPANRNIVASYFWPAP